MTEEQTTKKTRLSDYERTRRKVEQGGALELALFEPMKFGVIDLISGKMYQRSVSFIDEPTVASTVEDRTFIESSLPLSLAASDTPIPLPFGLTVVSGPTAVGKTSFLRALPDIRRLIVVECPDSIQELKTLPIYSSVDAALLASARLTITHQALYALDGLRAPLFETTGPAGSKGVIMPFFTQITRVSNALARNGLTVLATVNPMDDEPGYERAFLSKLSASVPCFISLLPECDPEHGLYTGTIATREERKPQRFTFDTRAGGRVITEEVGFTMPVSTEETAPLSNLQITHVQEK
jgi:hypothetical protein